MLRSFWSLSGCGQGALEAPPPPPQQEQGGQSRARCVMQVTFSTQDPPNCPGASPPPWATGDLSSSLSGPAFSASTHSGEWGKWGAADGSTQMVTTRRSGEGVPRKGECWQEKWAGG